MSRSIRSLAWFSIAFQPVFVAAWIVAGARQDGYSHVDSGVSALAADGMRDPWIAAAALIGFGLSVAALAPGIRATLPRGRARTLAVALFALAGAAFVLAGVLPLDCDLSKSACNAQFEAGALSWQTDVHLWAALIVMVAIFFTPFAIARALWPSPVAGLVLAVAGAGLALVLTGFVAAGAEAGDGLVQRIQFAASQVWVVLVAVGILYETRGEPKLSEPAPLRPRDFFGSSWSGEGVAVPYPRFFWRRLAPRFRVSRTTEWHTDDLGIVTDRAILANGRVEERVRYARLIDPAHIHVTADDMPDGADVVIDERGFQIAPYRVLVPVGPARFLLRSRDRARIDADGTLEYVSRLSWHGLPVAALELRARPVDTAQAGATPTRSSRAAST